jgi:hypothetical protein
MRSYEEALRIDFNDLHTNWKNHSDDFMYWAKKWAEAVEKKDKLKEMVKVRSAEIEMGIRKEFAARPPKNIKVTESVIASEVTMNDELKGLRNQILETNKDVDVYAAAKAAFESRKKALEGITSLWIAGYYSTPNAPREFKEVANEAVRKKSMEAHQKEIKKGNIRLKRRKKSE